MCYPLLIQSPGSQSGHFQTTFASKTSINSTCLLSTFTTTDDPNIAFNSFFYPHVFVAVHSSSNCSACGMADNRAVLAIGRIVHEHSATVVAVLRFSRQPASSRN